MAEPQSNPEVAAPSRKRSSTPRLLVVALCTSAIAVSVIHYVVVSSSHQAKQIDPKKVTSDWKHDRNYNYVATTDNDSRRGGLPQTRVSPEALRLAADYQKIIYPALRKRLAINPVLPGSITAIPGLSKYASLHPLWSSLNSMRLDGTMIGHDLYSKNAPNKPHDPWTSYTITTKNGHPIPLNQYITVCGWDDGRVTFDAFSTLYEKKVKTPMGEMDLTAPPGAAGIPPHTPQVKDLFPALR